MWKLAGHFSRLTSQVHAQFWLENLKLELTIFLGANTTVTFKTHKGTIPTLPGIGEALSIIHIDVPVPQVSTPGSPDDDAGIKRPHFIQDATVQFPSKDITSEKAIK